MRQKYLSRESYYYAFLFILNLIIHFFALYENCTSLDIDEAAIGYSSWCLANYGTDRYGNSWPIYIQNFYGGQSPAYAYLLIPIIKILGLTPTAIRLLNAVFFMIGFVFLIKLINRINIPVEERISATSLYTIAPSLIILSRVGLDCILLLPFMIISIYFIVKAIETKKTTDYITASIACATSLYTYALAYIMIPLLLITIFICLIRNKDITVKNSIAVIITFTIISIPIFIQAYTMLFLDSPWKLGPMSFIKMEESRDTELSLLNLLIGIPAVIYVLLFRDNQAGIYASTVFSNMYLISIPFIIIGIFSYIKHTVNEWKEKKINFHSVITFSLIIGIFVLAINNHVAVYMSASLLFHMTLFAARGINILINSKKVLPNRKKQKTIMIILMYVTLFLLFINYYFVTGEYDKQIKSRYSLSTPLFTEELEYIKETKLLAEKEIHLILPTGNWLYIPLSLGGIDPKEISYIDDKKNPGEYKVDYTYKNMHTGFKDPFDSDGVYIVSKHNIQGRYDRDVLENVTEMKHSKNFRDYTIYWN